jgi:hypothetical protein
MGTLFGTPHLPTRMACAVRGAILERKAAALLLPVGGDPRRLRGGALRIVREWAMARELSQR